jgi:hypothetical protein
MKQIQPFQHLFASKFVTVTGLTITSQYDNLIDSVTFNWSVSTADGVVVGGGVTKLGADDPEGTSYTLWDGTEQGAYNIVCNRVGFVLV